MEFYIFAVYDRLIGAFGNILKYRSEAHAVRDFTAAMNTDVHDFADQYDLWYLGKLNCKNGVISDNEHLRCIVTGASIKAASDLDPDQELEQE